MNMELDCRAMLPPEPLERAMIALGMIGSDGELNMLVNLHLAFSAIQR